MNYKDLDNPDSPINAWPKDAPTVPRETKSQQAVQDATKALEKYRDSEGSLNINPHLIPPEVLDQLKAMNGRLLSKNEWYIKTPADPVKTTIHKAEVPIDNPVIGVAGESLYIGDMVSINPKTGIILRAKSDTTTKEQRSVWSDEVDKIKEACTADTGLATLKPEGGKTIHPLAKRQTHKVRRGIVEISQYDQLDKSSKLSRAIDALFKSLAHNREIETWEDPARMLDCYAFNCSLFDEVEEGFLLPKYSIKWDEINNDISLIDESGTILFLKHVGVSNV